MCWSATRLLLISPAMQFIYWSLKISHQLWTSATISFTYDHLKRLLLLQFRCGYVGGCHGYQLSSVHLSIHISDELTFHEYRIHNFPEPGWRHWYWPWSKYQQTLEPYSWCTSHIPAPWTPTAMKTVQLALKCWVLVYLVMFFQLHVIKWMISKLESISLLGLWKTMSTSIRLAGF